MLLLALLVGLRALTMVLGRFVKFDGPLGWPLGAASREAFWRRTLPWPSGVQEDDEIAWHVPRSVEPVAPSPRRPVSAGRPVPPTHPQRRIGSH